MSAPVPARRARALAWIGVAALLVAALGVSRWVRPPRAPADVRTTVADAASHPGAASYDLVGGTLRPDLGATVGGAFTVHPLVPARWTPDAPVPVWVAAGPGAGPLAPEGRRGIAVAAPHVDGYRGAIAEAERAHGIHGEVGAPIVYLATSQPP